MLRDLVDSPLAQAYSLEVIATYRGRGRVQRLTVFARAVGALIRWCLGDGRRIVHVHTAVRGSIYRKAICVAAAKLTRRPVILHFHAGPGDIDDFVARVGPLRLWLLRRAVGSADRVLSVSTVGARKVEQVLGASDVVVVPNAAPRVELEADGDREVRSAGDGAQLAYMGGFADPAKGGEVLIAALADIVETVPDVEVILAGPGTPPAALADLTGRHAGIRWVGWLDGPAKHQLLSTCDVFLLPSVSEGLPVALLEAMAYGRAIVATRVGGVPDVLADRDDALLVESGDREALVGAVAAVASDAELRGRLGSAARERASRLNADEVFGRLDAIYRQLAA